MRTKMTLSTEYPSLRIVIGSNEEHEHFLAAFVAAVASGGITFDKIETKFPDNELFTNDKDSSFEHCWEEFVPVDISFSPETPLKSKSKKLLRLEKDNEIKARKAA